jgi:hypothetical protein
MALILQETRTVLTAYHCSHYEESKVIFHVIDVLRVHFRRKHVYSSLKHQNLVPWKSLT